MTVSPPLFTALNAIAAIMVDARDPWWIIGSAAVALHGADPGHVADVDLLLSVADARCVLPRIGLEPQQGSGHEVFRSRIFGIWLGTALPVEFMADFHRRSVDGWTPVRPASRKSVKVEDNKVFVPEREELHAMLIAFGRPKDRERALSLRTVTSQISAV